jgi:hypothetical protein
VSRLISALHLPSQLCMDIEAMLVNDVFVEWPENHNRLGRRQAQAIAIRPLRGQPPVVAIAGAHEPKRTERKTPP